MPPIYPLYFTWNGDAMVPERPGLADRQYIVGENYRLVPMEDRSPNSHRHFFAAIHEAWANLPEKLSVQFPTPDHLRKWALIKAGYHDTRAFAAASRKQAAELAAFVKPLDDFAVVTVSGAVVTVYTAKSQSMKAMGRRDFQDSKTKVLEVISAMIGTSRTALEGNAGQAA